MNIIIIAIIILVVVIGISIYQTTFGFSAQLRKAEEYLAADNLHGAVEIAHKLLERKNDYIPALYLKARISIKQKQFLMAISELNDIVAMPNHVTHIKGPEIHYHLAFLYNQTQNYLKEIEEYKNILV